MVTQSTILSWISIVISLAYQSATDEDCRAVMVKALEVQKISTSLLFRKNCAVQQVLKAGMWALQTSSSDFHLRCHPQHMDTFSIGLLVAAQEVA